MVNAAPALANGVPNVPELVIFEVGAENAVGRMEKLSVEQLVTVGEGQGYRTRTRTSRYAAATLKLPVVPRPLVRFTDWLVPAIVTGAPGGQFRPPVDPVTRSTCTVLVNVVCCTPLRIATTSRLK